MEPDMTDNDDLETTNETEEADESFAELFEQSFKDKGRLEPGEKVVTSSYDNFGDIDKLVLTK